MKAFKGFEYNMTCRGFHFKEDETYHNDNAELCKEGFHACARPIDTLYYYPPITSIYREVDLRNISEKKSEDDTKICGKDIKIGEEYNYADLIYETEHYDSEQNLSLTNEDCEISAAISSNEDNISIVADTPYSIAAASGTRDTACAYNGFSIAAVSGNDSGALAGGYTQSIAASTGPYNLSVIDGEYGAAITTGSYCIAYANRPNSIAIAWNPTCAARGVIGSYILCTEYIYKSGPHFGDTEIRAKLGKIDGKNLLPNINYILIGGEFTPVNSSKNEETICSLESLEGTLYTITMSDIEKQQKI